MIGGCSSRRQVGQIGEGNFSISNREDLSLEQNAELSCVRIDL